MLLDDAKPIASDLQRLKLAREAAALLKEKKTLTDSIADTMRALKIGKRMRELAIALGAKLAKKMATRPPAQALYPDAGKKTLNQRQRDNNAAIALLKQIQAGEITDVTDEQRAILAKYSGNGGGLIGADGLTGSPHEYYTPKPVAQAMWNLLGELGFKGGTVLDPSAGTGIFAATRPESAIVTQVELDPTSGGINAAINDGPTVNTTVSPFEAVASATPDESYDAIITNVPFGDLAMRGDNPAKDKRFQKRNLQEYFILRSLQKLRPHGLAAFIVPPSIVGGKGAKASKLRMEASLMAEFLGAYRLPNKIFSESAAADTITDVIVFRKFSREAAEKIDQLLAQQPQVLTQANVLYPEFLEGRYFAGEGRKYVLGEMQRGTGKFGEVDKVVSDDSVANIAALIKRFPSSRVDWAMLDATETSPIEYADGDLVHSNGQTLKFAAGAWVPLESASAEDQAMIDIGLKVQTPLDAVNKAVPWEAARRWAEFQAEAGRHLDVPAWLVATVKVLDGMPENQREEWWAAVTAGMATMNLLQASDSVEPFNYVEAYPVLSQQLIRVQSYGGKTIGKASRLVRDALLSIRNARYKGEFTPFWRGEIRSDAVEVSLTPSQLYEKVKYQSQDEAGYVPVEKLRQAFSDFDPLASDEWCVSADGQSVVHARDYYAGSYGAFLKRAQADLEAAVDPAVRAKLVKQMDAAKERLNNVDVSKMTFNLVTPYISNAQKLEFLRQYVSPDIFLTTDANGKEMFDIKPAPTGKYIPEDQKAQNKALQRFVKGYLRNQNITTMSRADDVEADPARETALLRRIKELTDRTKAQFDTWARANEEVQASLNSRLNSPDALRFIEEPDTSPLDIPGLNVDTFRPHGYQYGAIRSYSKKFAGILGFDVGLGKTLTGLAAVQYVQSIGVKKKTIFVVPNATLTNWKKEAGRAYTDIHDCLFVGIVTGKNGKDKVDNAQVKADLNAIRENRHSKIFMTLEAFKQIPLREETMESYLSHLATNDDAYLLAEMDEQKKRANIAAASKSNAARATGEKSGAVPFLEDMGVDSVVLDEGHNYKNSKTTSSEFKGAKYLSDPTKSQRGLDMQAKCWYIRAGSDRNDGVLVLTATPVTNSPLEAYSMLTLALGEQDVNSMFGVTGADSFMAAACDVEEREEENIVGVSRPVRVFTGLQNAGLLRRVLRTAAIIKTANDVKADGIDIAVPEAEEVQTNVDIGADAINAILDYKQDYMDAVERLKKGEADPEDKLLASPFNLIRKMTRVINDRELDRGIFRFKYKADQAEAAQKAVDAFNAKNIVEERDYSDPNAAESDIKVKMTKDAETGETTYRYLVTVRARLAGGAVEVLSSGYSTQEALLKLLAANGIDSPKVEISPKIAAVLANVKLECSAPRHMGQAKQIIFCDEISLHHKLKLALTQQVGIPAGKIKIVNAEAVDVAGMQEVQDGFNADGDENKYQIVIANKKAEVGINLQKGTQAIHHFTIGWTPDSIHQRNGRGVRQGNPVQNVRVYFYDANGTFDTYKRNLVGVKADWIGSLMSGDSSKIVIEGDMSAEDYEMLANAVGDASAMVRINEEIAARNERQKRAAARVAQVQNLRIIESQASWLKRFGPDKNGRESAGFAAWANSKIAALNVTTRTLASLTTKREESESDLMRKRLSIQIGELERRRADQRAQLEGLATGADGLIKTRAEYENIDAALMASPIYQAYQKDLKMAERMKNEAAEGFKNRADSGYAASDLDLFMEGKGTIVTGNLVAQGTLIEYQGQLLVAIYHRSQGKMVAFNPATLDDFDLLKMQDATFIPRGSAGWSAAVKRAIQMDEAKIRSSADGFDVGSLELYASSVPDVQAGLSLPIPSQLRDTETFMLRAPHFPIIVRPGETGSAVLKAIRDDQAELISEWGGYGGGAVRLRDIAVVGETGHSQASEKLEAMRAYCLAHRVRLQIDDFPLISRWLEGMTALRTAGVIAEFFKALPDALASMTTAEQAEAWALDWLQRRSEWIEIGSIAEALGIDFPRFRKAVISIEDGVERFIKLPDTLPYGPRDAVKKMLVAAAEAGAANDALLALPRFTARIADYFAGWSDLVKHFFSEDAEGKAVLSVPVDGLRELVGGNSKAKYFLSSMEAAKIWLSTALQGDAYSMIAAAKSWKEKQAKNEAGVNVDGMVAALLAVPGINAAKLGTVNAMKARDRYTGEFLYQAGQYMLVGCAWGSEVSKKISAKGGGLEGRTFDNEEKCFRVSLAEGQKFSDGQKVASVSDLFAVLGLNIQEFLT